jgi:hypothetical protein
MSTVEIEKYFQKNKNNINLENNTLMAWKSGSLINCQGNELDFEKNKNFIQRRTEYDYTVLGHDLLKRKELNKTSFKKVVFEKVINRLIPKNQCN